MNQVRTADLTTLDYVDDVMRSYVSSGITQCGKVISYGGEVFSSIGSWLNPPPPPTLTERLTEEAKNRYTQVKGAVAPVAEKVQQFAAEYPNTSAVGSGILGLLFTAKGIQNLGDGNKKQGLLQLALGTVGLGSAAYIQKESAQLLISQIKTWVTSNILETTEVSALTAAIGGGSLIMGLNDLYHGNKKLAAIEMITGIAGTALGAYGLFGSDEVCAAS